MDRPSLYLFPVGLGDAPLTDVLPAVNAELLRSMRYLAVENLRTARRFLKAVDRDIDIYAITFFELNEHTQASDIPAML
ncbi:MAG: SAM-dependent methyltransferase, partial [Muribaculaceae bacterium]|nr:SAM-dependent methyltransferase [Muribaculaceae bacterium]